MMKRQRGSASGVGVVTNLNPSKFEQVPTMVAMQGKKKPKREFEKVKGELGESAVEEERKENRDVRLMETEDNMMGWTCNLEENWPGAWLQSELVDEQMSWGSLWCPVWDLDFNAEAFGTLYSDVLWDDDIWNLKKEIPNPSESRHGVN
ncbi:hypothetical protein L6164_001740 [Bauhinia variegata]|uniref:Uncharacterized protein n=1 Tax=Bauhinia variegata TaxID=167791 RepID=A0ACB9QAL7_BAUVA|nr:hypothetical protein L6164_001740 [Bauhinia variegata]